jgi:acyl-coenzyme A thioesterase PaaI-like protein
LAKIRLISYVRPRVVDLTDERCEIVVPLSWRTRNHLRSMYFGALCTGADAAAALAALRASRRAGGRVAVVFKDVQAEFLKRAEADVHFACDQSREILTLIEKADASGERENLPVRVVATVPKLFGSEPVARFTLTLSVKRR